MELSLPRHVKGFREDPVRHHAVLPFRRHRHRDLPQLQVVRQLCPQHGKNIFPHDLRQIHLPAYSTLLRDIIPAKDGHIHPAAKDRPALSPDLGGKAHLIAHVFFPGQLPQLHRQPSSAVLHPGFPLYGRKGKLLHRLYTGGVCLSLDDHITAIAEFALTLGIPGGNGIFSIRGPGDGGLSFPRCVLTPVPLIGKDCRIYQKIVPVGDLQPLRPPSSTVAGATTLTPLTGSRCSVFS